MPPKLPYHRKSASPYAVKPTATPRRSGKESSKLSSADVEPSSSSDPDEDPNESSVSDIRKRKAAVGARPVDKKRKGISSSTVIPTSASTAHSADEEDDDDEAQHDSLDDLSDLSGLSD
jgi:hypothetical protein